MVLVRLLTGEYYVVDFDTKGQPAFASGPVPQEVLEMFSGADEDVLEGYSCYYGQGDPDATVRWLESREYRIMDPEQRRQCSIQS